MHIHAHARYAPLVLRIGMALVMFWFGSQQLMNPSAWTGFLPGWVGSLPLSDITFIQLNGLFEVVASALLVIGFQMQIVAAVLAVHLAGVVMSVGYTATGVRDFGLVVALAALTILGPDVWTFDARQSARTVSQDDLTNP